MRPTFVPHHNRLPGRISGGFTLVELLVVIAVLALLLGILVPAVIGVQTEWLRHACRNNLSNLGKGLITYAQGKMNRGGAPFLPSLDMNKGGNGWNQWPGTDRRAVTDEVKGGNSSALWLLVDADICAPENFICPEARRLLGHRPAIRADHRKPDNTADGEGRFQFNTISYSYLSQVGYDEAGAAVPGMCLTTADSTRLVLLGDRNPYAMPSGQVNASPTTNSTNHKGDGQNFFLLNQQVLWIEKLGPAADKMDTRLNGDHPYLNANFAYPSDAKRSSKNDSLVVQ